VVFVCTANSARSHLAAAVWRSAHELPAASAGTHPARRIAPGAIRAARRRRLPLERVEPVALTSVVRKGDLLVTVCDQAHEQLDGVDQLHWSIPDPVTADTAAAYDAVIDELDVRVQSLAERLG
jgi:protein-tyrosine-phosphatase